MTDGISGFIVDSPEQAIAVLARIDDIGRHQCRVYFERRFSAEAMATGYVKLYRELIDGGRNCITGPNLSCRQKDWQILTQNDCQPSFAPVAAGIE